MSEVYVFDVEGVEDEPSISLELSFVPTRGMEIEVASGRVYVVRQVVWNMCTPQFFRLVLEPK